jgi:hypothetical protein
MRQLLPASDDLTINDSFLHGISMFASFSLRQLCLDLHKSRPRGGTRRRLSWAGGTLLTRLGGPPIHHGNWWILYYYCFDIGHASTLVLALSFIRNLPYPFANFKRHVLSL